MLYSLATFIALIVIPIFASPPPCDKGVQLTKCPPGSQIKCIWGDATCAGISKTNVWIDYIEKSEECVIKAIDIDDIVEALEEKWIVGCAENNEPLNVDRKRFDQFYVQQIVKSQQIFLNEQQAKQAKSMDQAKKMDSGFAAPSGDELKKLFLKLEQSIPDKSKKWGDAVFDTAFKSVQSCGDCGLASLNNLLFGHYITNLVLGEVFILNDAVKISEQQYQQKKHKGELTETYAVYKTGDKKKVPIRYEGLKDEHFTAVLDVVNAQESRAKFIPKLESPKDAKFINWYGKDAENIVTAVLNAERRFTAGLIGLQFVFYPSHTEKHSVALHYVKDAEEIAKAEKETGWFGTSKKKWPKNKHWIWINGWKSADSYLFSDEELADYLVNYLVGDVQHFPKKLYVVKVKGGRKQILPPPEGLFKDEEKLQLYWMCMRSKRVQKELNEDDAAECRKEAGFKAMVEYENSYYDEIELKEEENIIHEINELKNLEMRLNQNHHYYYSKPSKKHHHHHHHNHRYQQNRLINNKYSPQNKYKTIH